MDQKELINRLKSEYRHQFERMTDIAIDVRKKFGEVPTWSEDIFSKYEDDTREIVIKMHELYERLCACGYKRSQVRLNQKIYNAIITAKM